MGTPIHLHIFGAEPHEAASAARCLRASDGLSTADRQRLEDLLHYGSPEAPDMAPPVSWSLVHLSEEWHALIRSWRPPARATSPSPLIAVSAVFPAGADLAGSGALLSLADHAEVFPEDPGTLPNGPLQHDFEAPGGRATDAFDRLLQTVRGDRRALVALLAACATAADEEAALRAVVLSLPDVGFRDAGALLRTMVGLSAALPRPLRLRLPFTTYQDSPAPRPLPLLAIPENHRCMPRLVRSNGYVVFPGPPPAEALLSSRALRHAEAAAELLLAGRFEEARALSAAQDVARSPSSAGIDEDIERHAELLRIAESPTCDSLQRWTERHGVPTDEERQELLFSGFAGAIDIQARAGQPAPACALLERLGRRWPEPDWGRTVQLRLQAPLAALIRSWQQEEGWAAVLAFLEAIAGAGLWLRVAFWEASARALAETGDGGALPADVAAFAGALEEMLDGLDGVQPPAPYVRWRTRHAELGDALREGHLLRILALPNAQELLFELLTSFDAAAEAPFAPLLRTALAAVLTHRPEFAVDLVVDLSAHYREEIGGLEVVAIALPVLHERGAAEPTTEFVSRTLLRASQGSARFRRRHAGLLAQAVRAVPVEHWRSEFARISAVSGNDRALLLANLRRLWTAALAPPAVLGAEAVAREIVRIERAETSLCADPSPHEALLRQGGPGPGARLAVDEVLLLAGPAEEENDESVERHLTAIFSLYSRCLPDDPYTWQRALLDAATAATRTAEERGLVLWWFWSVARRHGFPHFGRHAAHRLVSLDLLSALPTAHFELLCRLLPSESGYRREKLLQAAVEAELARWRRTRREETELPSEIFRLFSPQADRLSEAAYVALVRRYAEECLLVRDPSDDDLRKLLDRVYVPRYWEALAGLFQELAQRRPWLRSQLAGLRKTTLGRRLPPQLLGRFSSSPGTAKPPTTTLE